MRTRQFGSDVHVIGTVSRPGVILERPNKCRRHRLRSEHTASRLVRLPSSVLRNTCFQVMSHFDAPRSAQFRLTIGCAAGSGLGSQRQHCDVLPFRPHSCIPCSNTSSLNPSSRNLPHCRLDGRNDAFPGGYRASLPKARTGRQTLFRALANQLGPYRRRAMVSKFLRF